MRKTFAPKFICLVLAALVLSCADQTLGEGEFAVGRKKVKIPNPESYVRIDGINADYDRVISSALPATNKLLAFFGTEKDRGDLKGGREVQAMRNFNAQSINARMDCTLANFATVSAMVEKETKGESEKLNAMIKENTKDTLEMISDLSDDKVALQLGTPVPLGVLDKGDTWVTFAMKIPMEITTDGKKEKVVNTTVNSLVLVNSKVIGLYGTHIDGGDDAMDKLKEDIDAWKAAVFEANK